MDLEQLAIAAGMENALNLGSGSCVQSDGCHGVTQEHLERFAELVRATERKRCAAAVLATPTHAWTNGSDQWGNPCPAKVLTTREQYASACERA